MGIEGGVVTVRLGSRNNDFARCEAGRLKSRCEGLQRAVCVEKVVPVPDKSGAGREGMHPEIVTGVGREERCEPAQKCRDVGMRELRALIAAECAAAARCVKDVKEEERFREKRKQYREGLSRAGPHADAKPVPLRRPFAGEVERVDVRRPPARGKTFELDHVFLGHLTVGVSGERGEAARVRCTPG